MSLETFYFFPATQITPNIVQIQQILPVKLENYPIPILANLDTICFPCMNCACKAISKAMKTISLFLQSLWTQKVTFSQNSIGLMGLNEPIFIVNFPKKQKFRQTEKCRNSLHPGWKSIFCTLILKTICLNTMLLFTELVFSALF